MTGISRASTFVIVIAAASVSVPTDFAFAECYLSLPAASGFSQAGPYADMSQCQAVAANMYVDANCSCSGEGGDAPPPPPAVRPEYMEHYNHHVHVLYEMSTRAMEPFLSLPPPRTRIYTAPSGSSSRNKTPACAQATTG
jgi:hypothetical protein